MFRLNPFTGRFDLSNALFLLFDHIISTQCVFVKDRTQYPIFHTFKLEGTIKIDGTLVIRD